VCAGCGFIKPWFVEREFLAYFQAFDRVFQAKLNAKKRFISFVLQLKVRAASIYGVRGNICAFGSGRMSRNKACLQQQTVA